MTLYPFLISFIMVFIAELGDKTQFLILSFAGRVKTRKIIIGIIIGSLFSHGLAILFGSRLGVFDNQDLQNGIKNITYISFILIGIISIISTKKDNQFNNTTKNTSKSTTKKDKKQGLIYKIYNLNIGYTLIIALSIFIGEFGDKTFLSSIGFGIEYPNYKVMLIFGAILGMVVSDSIAILSGKFLSTYISEKKMKKFSGILFLIFGLCGLLIK